MHDADNKMLWATKEIILSRITMKAIAIEEKGIEMSLEI
jgi:hypothetical protein